MEIMKEKTCCIIGHRRKSLKGSEKMIRQMLTVEIGRMVSTGITVFISGMADGAELWAADIICRMKKKEDLKLVCALPFPGMEKKLSEKAGKRFSEILSKADQTEILSEEYSEECFSKRDRWMIDHASRVIAVYNGAPGGTRRAIEYAREAGKEPVLIEDKEVQHCTICGKELDCFDLQEKLGFEDIMGYGSRYDCCHIRFRLCCGCFDKLIDGMKKHGKEDPVICTDVRFAGELTSGQTKRVKRLFGFMNQAGTDAFVRRISKMNSEEIETEIRKMEDVFEVPQ